MADQTVLYPRWLKLWHSVNGTLCLFLMITGLVMQYASPSTIVFSFPTAINIHNICGILLIISWIIFIIANALSKNGSYYKISIKLIRESTVQFRYYIFGMFKGQSKPFKEDEVRKFNPLQQLTYWLTMYVILPLIVITGFIMINIEQLLSDEHGIFIYQIADLLHICAAFLISVFMIIHFYLASLDGKSNFKKII